MKFRLLRIGIVGLAVGAVGTMLLTIGNAVLFMSEGINLATEIDWPMYLGGAIFMYFLPLAAVGTLLTGILEVGRFFLSNRINAAAKNSAGG